MLNLHNAQPVSRIHRPTPLCLGFNICESIRYPRGSEQSEMLQSAGLGRCSDTDLENLLQ